METAIQEKKLLSVAPELNARLFYQLMDHVDDAIFIIDPESGSLLDFNKTACERLGYSQKELLGKDLKDIEEVSLEDNSFHKYLDRIKQENGLMLEGFHRCKDGTKIPVEINVNYIDYIGKGYLIAVVREISQRKEMESQMLQATKLESIGQLSAGIAHEINTPTQYIGDNTHFVQDSLKDLTGLISLYQKLLPELQNKKLPEELIAEIDKKVQDIDLEFILEETPKAIEQALEGIERVTKIVQAMKDFSHPSGEDKQTADLNKVIQSTLTVARNEYKYVADLNLELDSNLPLVNCFPDELNQVILNMVVNAAHAITDVVGDTGQKGTITVRTVSKGDSVEIHIQDSGKGIPEDIQDKIFDPFFTTKDVGKGTGQGLHIAHNIVKKKHQGAIALESELGKGTTFILTLPVNGGDEETEK